MAWSIGICCALPNLVCSEALSVELGLDVFFICLLGLLGVLGEIGLLAPYLRASKSKKILRLVWRVFSCWFCSVSVQCTTSRKACICVSSSNNPLSWPPSDIYWVGR